MTSPSTSSATALGCSRTITSEHLSLHHITRSESDLDSALALRDAQRTVHHPHIADGLPRRNRFRGACLRRIVTFSQTCATWGWTSSAGEGMHDVYGDCRIGVSIGSTVTPCARYFAEQRNCLLFTRHRNAAAGTASSYLLNSSSGRATTERAPACEIVSLCAASRGALRGPSSRQMTGRDRVCVP